jgi:hypothetical protein
MFLTLLEIFKLRALVLLCRIAVCRESFQKIGSFLEFLEMNPLTSDI